MGEHGVTAYDASMSKAASVVGYDAHVVPRKETITIQRGRHDHATILHLHRLRCSNYDLGNYFGATQMIHEYLGDNRSGKTFLMALASWEDYNQGKDVYVNCPEDPHSPTGYNCILNFPHYHIDLDAMKEQSLFNCSMMSDESVEFMDARRASSNRVREIGLFGYQATKRGVDWRFDAVRHKNIDPRIRLNPHYIHESFRIPKDPRQPLVSVRVRTTYRYGGVRTWFVLKPWLFYPVYNHIVLVRNEN